MCATSSVTLTAVSRLSWWSVPKRILFWLVCLKRKKQNKKQNQMCPKVQSQPTSCSRQFLLVVTNWKSSCVSVGSVTSEGPDEFGAAPPSPPPSSVNTFGFERKYIQHHFLMIFDDSTVRRKVPLSYFQVYRQPECLSFNSDFSIFSLVNFRVKVSGFIRTIIDTT